MELNGDHRAAQHQQQQQQPPPPSLAVHKDSQSESVTAGSFGADRGGAGGSNIGPSAGVVHPRARGLDRECKSDMPPRGEPEREGVPCSGGNTPREEGEREQRWASVEFAQQQQQQQPIRYAASPSVAAYDPHQPCGSLFGKNGGGDVPAVHTVIGARQAARPLQYHTQQQSSTAPAVVHEPEHHRPYPANEVPGRQKSSAYRTLMTTEEGKPLCPINEPAAAVAAKETEHKARRSGPSAIAVRGNDAAPADTLVKIAVQTQTVNRVEQNTGEKYHRQTMTTSAAADHYPSSLSLGDEDAGGACWPGGDAASRHCAAGHDMQHPHLGISASAEPAWEPWNRPEPSTLNTK